MRASSQLENAMSQLQESEFTLSPVYQLGYVVSDIERACRYYESVFGTGTGPFSEVIDVNMEGAILRGKPGNGGIGVSIAGPQVEGRH